MAVRFGLLLAFPVAALGGLATAWADRAYAATTRRRRALRIAVLALLVVVLRWDAGDWPMAVRPIATRLPDAYGLLEQARAGLREPVLELPMGLEPRWPFGFPDPEWVYWSTYHRHTLVNGYSGYQPVAYPLVTELSRQLPDRDVLVTIARLTGVRWLLVHLDRLEPLERERWTDLRAHAAGASDDAMLVEVPRPDADWQARYLAPPIGRTLLGTRLAPLGPGARASVVVEVPDRITEGQPVGASVTVQNIGTVRWPALAPDQDGRVTLEVWWSDTPRRVTRAVLPGDIAPRQRVHLWIPLVAPKALGPVTLHAQVAQRGAGAITTVGVDRDVAVVPTATDG
jgi:hypothetical protein